MNRSGESLQNGRTLCPAAADDTVMLEVNSHRRHNGTGSGQCGHGALKSAPTSIADLALGTIENSYRQIARRHVLIRSPSLRQSCGSCLARLGLADLISAAKMLANSSRRAFTEYQLHGCSALRLLYRRADRRFR
jgi:hypothetical protein